MSNEKKSAVAASASPKTAKPVELTLKQQLEQALAENARLKAAKAAKQVLTPKISKKGAVSLYGLGRFPVTLYKEQWLRLIGVADTITSFIEEHDSQLVSKAQSIAAQGEDVEGEE